jgi:hypothetical protein
MSCGFQPSLRDCPTARKGTRHFRAGLLIVPSPSTSLRAGSGGLVPLQAKACVSAGWRRDHRAEEPGHLQAAKRPGVEEKLDPDDEVVLEGQQRCRAANPDGVAKVAVVGQHGFGVKHCYGCSSVCQPGLVQWPSFQWKISVTRPLLVERLPAMSVSRR